MIHFIKVVFFRVEKMCANDFKIKQPETIILLNVNMIVSLSEVLIFYMPLSGKRVGKYCILTTITDKYIIYGERYQELFNKLNTYIQ